MGANSTCEKELYVTSYWDTMEYIAITTDPAMNPDGDDDGRLYKKDNPNFDEMYKKLANYQPEVGSGLNITYEIKRLGIASYEYIITDIGAIPTYQIKNTTIKRLIPHSPQQKSRLVSMYEETKKMKQIIDSNSNSKIMRVSIDKRIEDSSFLNIELSSDEPYLIGKRIITDLNTKNNFNFYNGCKYYRPLSKIDDTKYNIIFRGIGINLALVRIELYDDKV